MIKLNRLLAVAALSAIAIPTIASLPNGTQSAHAANFNSLNGAWRGGGRLNLANGKSENLRCRAYYNTKSGGKRLGMAVRCASTSYKFELRAQLAVSGNRVTGNWEERNFNATGSIRGSLKPGRMSLTASGSITAGLSVTFGGNRQRVRLSGKFDNFRGLSLALRK